MPLIIITGLPTSGKTTRAKQLHAYLSERISTVPSSSSPDAPSVSAPPPKYRLHFISDTTQSIPRTVYDLSPSQLPAHVRSANASEKDARAAVYGAVKRVLSPRDIVVLDGLNYIKGWRYQLFCEAKNVRTASCVLQVGCAVERARGVNEARLERRRKRKEGKGELQGGGDGNGEERSGKDGEEERNDEEEEEEEEEPYEPSNWENLVFRYEEPNPMTRWDSPLFTLVWEDDEAQTRQVFDKIWDAIAGEGRKAVKPNQSTVQRDKDPGGDYLYVLERETQDIVKKILEKQSPEGGGVVSLPRVNNAGVGEAGEELVVELPGKKVGLPQLQRYRRAFVALNRGGIGLEAVGKLAAGRLRESFVGYLNDAFEKDG
ncbi:chromatin associated protein KTI12 [Achaetomium macrosporum]|uniref:Chromatin associated protein KTI12 n=1 Tax=Achaetomium macrosporum TaxID=79813 RepID=A0AAN7HEP6_9PEZI|nr:chromatin associated protein KTI12 [Achaetomium macrosporum]